METDQNVYFLLFIIFLYYSLINLFIFKYDYKKKKKKKIIFILLLLQQIIIIKKINN